MQLQKSQVSMEIQYTFHSQVESQMDLMEREKELMMVYYYGVVRRWKIILDTHIFFTLPAEMLTYMEYALESTEFQ